LTQGEGLNEQQCRIRIYSGFPKDEIYKNRGTDYPPLKRIKEINLVEPYKSLGPWTLGDFRQVRDWRKIEYGLHYVFRSKLAENILGQKELFEISLHEASSKLKEIDTSEVVNKPQVDRLFNDEEFCNYLVKLFGLTGLMNWLDAQGAWTFVLFPGTAGGRYFTINIGPHEVAFSTLQKKKSPNTHMILMDKLILDFDNVKRFVVNNGGAWNVHAYDTALPRALSVCFNGKFNTAIDFVNLDGVRRAIIAYWTERLTIQKEDGNLSRYARYHNYNAIAELHRRIQKI
jgi:hypothetical protein